MTQLVRSTRLRALSFSRFAAPLALLAVAPTTWAQDWLNGDAQKGRAYFQQTCALCHATGEGTTAVASGQGPLLAGVVGRPAAALKDFGYTPALSRSKLTWDAATLDKFLANPQALVPGTNMVIMVPVAQDRANVIAFLSTLKAPALAAGGNAAAATEHDRTPGDWQNDAPGAVHRIDPKALAKPFATRSAGNSPRTVGRPDGAQLSVPPGFEVKLFASGLSGPRLLRTAPNGDIFIAETRAGRIRVLRVKDGADEPSENSVFAEQLRGPFGMAFYPTTGEPKWLYVANNNSVVRFAYKSGDLVASGEPETLLPSLSETTGGHTTRDLVFSADGKQMFISNGSASNVADNIGRKSAEEVKAFESTRMLGAAWGSEEYRAAVMVADVDGKNFRLYATGIRNAVGLALEPKKGRVWVSTNERDGLGDDLVPDYISHIEEGHFYGWPWYYWGNYEDPRRAGERPDLAGKATVPDVPIQAHSASLQLTVYPTEVKGASAFPKEYRGDIFAALHGSWNRTGRTGSKVVRVHLKDGVANGEYEDFLTGWVIDDGKVWGRPVGVTVANDGSLIVSDDAGGTLWRISYRGK